jgi:hypothetical protein
MIVNIYIKMRENGELIIKESTVVYLLILPATLKNFFLSMLSVFHVFSTLLARATIQPPFCNLVTSLPKNVYNATFGCCANRK